MKHGIQWVSMAGIWLWNSAALACAICAPSELESTVVQRLLAADVAVIAAAAPGGATYAPVVVIKGDFPKGPIRVEDAAAPTIKGAENSTALLAYRAGSQSWQMLGPLAAARADWAKALQSIPRAAAPNRPDAAWQKRLAFFVTDLESPEPLVAQTAYEEMSIAPYAALRTSSSRFWPS